MVHNGIEYGIMQAYAEGLNVLKHANVGNTQQETDAETAPLRDPDHYRYDLDLAAVTEVWRRGSVISSWLLDLTAAALVDSPTLDGTRASAFGRGPLDAARGDRRVGAGARPLCRAVRALRLARRAEFANRLLSAMRHAFGGHLEKQA